LANKDAKTMKHIFVFIAALFIGFGSVRVQAKELAISELMQAFATTSGIKASFTERKHLRILEAPVESSGELSFQAPDRLEKRTHQPRMEIMLIEANKVSIDRGSFKRSLQLSDYPDIASLVQSLTAVFRGDIASIEKFFTWQLKGTLQKWQLTLKPKSTQLFITLREIQFKGENNYIQAVETTLTDGDYSVMTLSRPLRSVAP
jgi:outer membrane lipoprotein-sorting protein